MHTIRLILTSLSFLGLIITTGYSQEQSCTEATIVDLFPTISLGCEDGNVNSELLICDSINSFFTIEEVNFKTYQLIPEEEHPLDLDFNICDGGVFDNPIFIPFIADSTFHSLDIIPILCDSFQLGPNTLSGIQTAIWESCDGENCLASNIACDLSTATNTINLNSNDFVVGGEYFIVVDGCGGSVCQFQVKLTDSDIPVSFNEVTFGCQVQNTNSHWFKYGLDNTDALSSILFNLNNYNLFDSTIVNTYHGTCDSITYISTNCYLDPSQNLTSFIDLDSVESDTIYFEVLTQSKFCHLFELEVIENENKCSRGEITVFRPEHNNIDNEGPYCPGETITVCYDLDFKIDQPGQGNNCQWLQGIIPVIKGDVDTTVSIEFLRNAPIGFGWDWLTAGNVDYNSEFSSYQYVNTSFGLGIEYGQSELTTGDLLPNGWWYTSPGSTCLNDGDPDNMWGLPTGCDTNIEINFCFDLKLESSNVFNCESGEAKSLEIEIFAFADGTTGCVFDDYCSFDKPAQFYGKVSCESEPQFNISNENIVSGDTIQFEYLDINGSFDIVCTYSENDKIEGPFNFSFLTQEDTTLQWIVTNLSDTIQTIVITNSIIGEGKCVNMFNQRTILVSPDPTVNIFIENLSNPTCGNENGAITISTSGNNTIEWSTGSNSNTIENLAEGKYYVTVSNQSLLDSLEIELIAQEYLILEIDDFSDTVCPYDAQGYIDLSVSDSTKLYEIEWNTGETELNVSNLAPGIYTATLTDENSCIDSTSILIDELPIVSFNLISNLTNCGDNNTTIQIEEFDSTLVSQIAWSDGSIGDSLTNVSEGLYIATITDINGCNQVVEHVVDFIDTSPPTLILEDISYTVPANGFVPEFSSFQFVNSLLDNCNGTIIVVPSTIQLDCTDAGENRITITAEDSAGNITTDTLVITIIDESPPFLFCPPSLNVFGCTPTEYDLPFQLDNCAVESIELIEGLGPGSVFPEGVTNERYLATDFGGNVDSCLVIITVDYGIEYQMVSLDVSCPELKDGSLIFNGSGVHEPINFNVTNHNGSLFNVPAGEYYIEIIDTLGCTLLDTLVVESPEEIKFENLNIIPIEDFTGNNGYIDITVSGGNSPYTYLWRKNGNIFSQNEDLENLEKGIYSLLIRDSFGCELLSQDFAIGILTSTNGVTEKTRINIYPNPSSDIVFFDSEDKIDYIKVFNTRGQLLLTQTTNTTNVLSVGHLDAGLYILVLGSNNSEIIKRLIVN